MRRLSSVMFATVLIAGAQYVPELLPAGHCYGSSTDIMYKVDKYKDSLTPEQYQSLSDRANEIGRMMRDGPPRRGNEYDAAINSLADQAKQLAQERKDIMSQNEQSVIDELKRLDSTYEQYSKNMSEQQRKQFLTTASGLQARWADSAWDSKSVNQAVTDSSQLLTDIRKLSSSIIEMASISPGKQSPPLKARRPPTFVGNSLDEEPASLEHPGLMDTDEIVPDYTNSYRNTPFAPPKMTAGTIGKSLSDLRIHLDGLNRIGVLGTLEYESLNRQLNDLVPQVESLKVSKTSDDGRTSLLQTLQNKITELRRAIDSAATK